MRLDELLWAIPLAWCKETRDDYARYGIPESVNKNALGQCIVSTLLIKRYCGGSMMRCTVGADSYDPVHYFNELDNGIWVDSTRSQFLSRAPVRNLKRNPDRSLWEFKDTWDRVDLLEERVRNCLSSTYVGPVPPWMKQKV